MATEIQEVITRYIAETQEYSRKIDEIIGKVRVLQLEEAKEVANSKEGVSVQKAAASQRKTLLEGEIANLKRLKIESKNAFTVPEIQKFNQQISQTKNNIALLKGETNAVGSAVNGFKAQLNGLGAGIIAAFSVNALKNFSLEAIKVSTQFESIRNAINFTQGSVEKGAEAFQFIKDTSQRLGLELVSTASSFKLFAGSAQLGGISAEETQRIFTSVSTAVTAMGLSAEDANGVFNALSQIVSKGTVAAEELRGQIGERLPGAFNIAAKSMGLTTKEFNKLLETGQVVSTEFLPKFATELQKTFEGALPNAVNSSQANLNRLTNTFTDFKLRLGDFIGRTGLLTGVTDFFDGLATALKSTEEIIADASQKANQSLIKQMESEADAILQARLKQVQDFEKFNPAEQEKIIADERIKIIEDFKDRLEKNTAEIEKQAPFVGNFNKAIRDEAVQITEALTRENNALEKVIATRSKDNTSSEAQINTVEKLKKQLQFLNNELEKLPLNKLNQVIDVKKQQDILKQIKDTQAAIDLITGKADEKSDERRKELLAKEKKLIDDINKLRVDLAPTPEEKIIIQAQIDNESFNKAENDVRTFAQIQKDVDSDKITFLRLNAIKLVSDLETIDEKRLDDLRKLAEQEIAIRNQNRLKTGDEESEQIKQNLIDRFEAEDELQDAIFEQRIQNEESNSRTQLEIQKEFLEVKAARERGAIEKEISDQIAKALKIKAVNLQLANDLSDIDTQILQAQEDKFIETFQNITNFADEFFSILTRFQIDQIEENIAALEGFRDAQLTSLDEQQTNLQQNRNKDLISQRQFEEQSAALKLRRAQTEKEANRQINEEKKRQAEKEKLLAIFTISLQISEAIASLNYFKAAIATAELAVVISTGIPALKKGTKDKKESGLTLVGEEGPELLHIPKGAQVLPTPKTQSNKEFINAMFDNKLDILIQKKYIDPAIKNERTSTSEKLIILKEKYQKVIERKEAIENYRERLINSIVTHNETKILNYVSETITKQVRQKSDTIFKEFHDTISRQYDFLKTEVSLAPLLIERRIEIEKEKQKSFAQSIAQSFTTHQVNNKNISEGMSMWDFVYAETNYLKGHRKKQFEFLAKQIASELSEILK